MEKNVRATIIDLNCNQIMMKEDYGTAAQALIAIKTYGHSQYVERESPTGWTWQIANYNKKTSEGEIDLVNGTFDTLWNPTIIFITTK